MSTEILSKSDKSNKSNNIDKLKKTKDTKISNIVIKLKKTKDVVTPKMTILIIIYANQVRLLIIKKIRKFALYYLLTLV
jgi:hypothetical protein